MNRVLKYIFIGALCFIAFPKASFAISDESLSATATTEDSDSCVAGSNHCSCSYVSGATGYSTGAAAAVTDAAACDKYCTNAGGDTFSLTCTYSSGATNQPVSQGNVGSTTAATTTVAVPTTTDKDFIVPNLNVKIPGLDEFSKPQKSTDGSTVTVNFLAEYINAIYGWAIAAGALVSVVMMMLGGLQYVLSRGKSKYIEKAKTRITNAITGLVLLLAAYNIAFLIDPSTVDLTSLNVHYVSPIIIDTDNTGSDVSALGLEKPDGTGTNGVPYFSQRDYTDAYPKPASCNDSSVVTILTSGCGPTSMAMILSYYGISTDPRRVAASFISNGYRACTGTYGSAFTSKKNPLLSENNLVGKSLFYSTQAERDVILTYLKNKEPIVITVGPKPSKETPTYKSTFTRSGHFLVLTGVNSDGTIAINDSNSSRKFITQTELWTTIGSAYYISRKTP